MRMVSFVIPCYKSASTLAQVVDEIIVTMDTAKTYTYEIVLVNDYSPDETFSVIEQLCKAHDNIAGINLTKNFGQHAALMAGMRHTSGDIVVFLDDDGQTPAREVGKLLAGIEEGFDVVYARYNIKKQGFFRRLGSSINDKMANILLGKPRNLQVTSYFATTRLIVDEMIRCQTPYPYVIGLVLRTTSNITSVDIEHQPRTVGESGYTLGKLFSLWLNGFTAFSVKPLRIATIVGGLFAMSGFIYTIVIVINRLVSNTAPEGWPTLISTLMISSGLLMVMVGLVGEYIGRMYISINQSPQYVIREVVGHRSKDDSTDYS